MSDCILVTGGAGFIGCAISRGLVSKGLPVIAVDKLSAQVHPSRERPSRLSDEVELITEDICEAPTWDRLFSSFRPTTVVHLCAETGTGQSLAEAALHTHTNVTGTACLLDAMSRHGIEPEKIVLASSRAVYGEGRWTAGGEEFYPLRRSHEQLLRQEWTPRAPNGEIGRPLPHSAKVTAPNPSSVYGATKLAQENILSAWCAARMTQLTTVRIQNAYGPGQSPTNPYTGIINLFHRVARSGQAIPVYEDGDIGRDFVFIDDVAAALLAAVELDSPTAPIDLGTGVRSTILQAAEFIADLHRAPRPIITGQFRDGDIRSAQADISALQEKLLVTPKTDLRLGLKRVGDWLVEAGYA